MQVVQAAGRLNGQACKADGAKEAEGEREPFLPGAPIGCHVAAEGGQGKDGRHEREEGNKEDKEVCWLGHCVLTIRVFGTSIFKGPNVHR